MGVTKHHVMCVSASICCAASGGSRLAISYRTLLQTLCDKQVRQRNSGNRLPHSMLDIHKTHQHEIVYSHRQPLPPQTESSGYNTLPQQHTECVCAGEGGGGRERGGGGTSMSTSASMGGEGRRAALGAFCFACTHIELRNHFAN